ncbi:hypothetical protein KJ596_03050 [Patescibacteria group bacterium]|nr:hypothetical protein [Patescibacteria group bacterium]
MHDIALLLHIYQPPTQFPEVVREIVEQSYWPLVEVLKEVPGVKIVLNICASLTEQLDKLGYQDLLRELNLLADAGRIEMTGSAKYHPLLSKLPPQEIGHQIALNRETNERLIYESFRPAGFFPPEMAYSSHVARAVEQAGHSWIIVEDFAFPDSKTRRHDVIYRVAGTKMDVIFRDKDLSLGLAFGDLKTPEEFLTAIKGQGDLGYRVIAMDGETFGHHHPGGIEVLRGILGLSEVNWLTISELIKEYDGGREEVEVLSSTWGAMELGSRLERIFPRWDNPDNPVHILQWQLFYLALSVMSRCESGQGGYLAARAVFDKAVHSDHFFWAGGDPCWHPEMVRRGAGLLRETIEKCPVSFPEEKERAIILEEKIVSLGKELHGVDIILE